MRVLQCELSCGERRSVAWIEKRLAKKGKQVYHPGKRGIWIVSHVYRGTELDDSELNRGWKVGGLS